MTLQNLVAELDEKREKANQPGFHDAKEQIAAEDDYNASLHNAYPQLRAAALAGAKVKDAWEIAGPRPDFHEAAKMKLRKEWPTLFKAIADYHSVIEANKRKPDAGQTKAVS